jgi:Cytidylate kinase-like family
VARGKSEKEAEELVDTVDRERADFIQKYFHVEWPDRAIYHTMINTTIGGDAVVQMILEVQTTPMSASFWGSSFARGGTVSAKPAKCFCNCWSHSAIRRW